MSRCEFITLTEQFELSKKCPYTPPMLASAISHLIKDQEILEKPMGVLPSEAGNSQVGHDHLLDLINGAGETDSRDDYEIERTACAVPVPIQKVTCSQVMPVLLEF